MYPPPWPCTQQRALGKDGSHTLTVNPPAEASGVCDDANGFYHNTGGEEDPQDGIGSRAWAVLSAYFVFVYRSESHKACCGPAIRNGCPISQRVIIYIRKDGMGWKWLLGQFCEGGSHSDKGILIVPSPLPSSLARLPDSSHKALETVCFCDER